MQAAVGTASKAPNTPSSVAPIDTATITVNADSRVTFPISQRDEHRHQPGEKRTESVPSRCTAQARPSGRLPPEKYLASVFNHSGCV